MHIFFLFIFIFVNNSSFAEEFRFNPLTTINSKTIPRNSFALSRGPLGNINSTFLSASLNYGLFSRLEIGTSPIFYFVDSHKYNYLAKLNFYQGEWIDWSVTFAENIFETEVATKKADFKMTSLQLAFNLHPSDQLWGLGASYTNACGYIDSADRMVFVYTYQCKSEYGVDLQYEFKSDQWLTVGMGKMRSGGISPYEEVNKGFGLAYTRFFEKKLFSRPSFGVYRQAEDFVILLTTTFFEQR